MNRNAGKICFIAKEEEGEKLSWALFNKEVHCVLFYSYFHILRLTINVVVMRQETG